jgi:hypothetical protein
MITVPKSDDITPPVPNTTLDRAALERVLARAAELQAFGSESGELFTERQLVELGKEVGLSPLHIRQAIAEERTRVNVSTERRGIVDHFGPVSLEARRMVQVPAASVFQKLERWMDKEECLQPKRRYQERITWEARRDFFGSIRRGFNLGGRGYALSSAHEVAATVTWLDEQNVLVQLSADFSNTRRNSIWGAIATVGGCAAFGLGVVALSVSLGGSLLIAGAAGAALTAMGAGIATVIAKANRELTARGQLALEQALDTIESGDGPPPQSVLGGLLNAAIREFR